MQVFSAHDNMDKEKIVDILSSIGYVLRPDGEGWRTNAIYRSGVKSNSLKINPNGTFKDFVNGYSGSLKKLVELTVGEKECNRIFNHKFKDDAAPKIKAESITFMKVLNKERELAKLHSNHKYWINRGISKNIIEKFQGGVCYEGRFKDRYTFPIFNGKHDLVGLSGRLLYEHEKVPKWKHYNGAQEWKYPLFLNHKIINKKKQVIIVESIGDCLSLFECGINNVVVSFGLNVSFALINLFMRYELEKIYIAFNNDENDNGNNAAEKEKKRIGKFFNQNTVKISLPNQRGEDFNSLLVKDKDLILDWYKKIKKNE